MSNGVHLAVPGADQRPATPSSALPENDGMAELRAKLHEIRELALSTEETAKRMHAIMTEEYAARHSAPFVVEQQRADFEGLTEEDVTPTYHPHSHVQEELDETIAEEPAAPMLGCQHYMRNVKIQCFDCNMWFPCRHCHDTSPYLPFLHQLNRKKTRKMLCMVCKTPQPASDVCMACGQEAATYYCPKCKLWDNDSTKRIYHCDDCGICRRGEGLGKDFVHCKRCNVCISVSTSATHPCVERATDCDCPLCLDHLFSSSTPVVSLLCGHYMHAACYKELMNVTYRCPVCNKSAVNMELQWRKLDDEIRRQPMPEEDFAEDEDYDRDVDAMDLADSSDSRLAGGLRNLSMMNRPVRTGRVPRKVWVGCNDCGGRGWAPFHWLGLRCPVCDGYNTNQMTPTGSSLRHPMTQPIAATLMQRQHDFTGAQMLQSFDDPALVNPTIQDTPSGIDVPRRPSNLAVSSPSRSYFLSSSPSSAPSPRSWASSLSPTRFTTRSQRSVSSSADDEPPTRSNEDYLTLLMARLDKFGISPSDFLSRVGISPSEFLARLNISPPDFLERFGISPYDFLHRVGRSLSPMRHYLESLDANARDRAAKAGERMGDLAAAMAEAAAGGGMRWSRRDVAEGMERWEALWRAQHEERMAGKDGSRGGEMDESEGEDSEESGDEESEGGEDVEEDEFAIFGHR